ncbi:hypothetical protein LOAG_06480 [Loa loa]|uniref:Uncharacterized protein n=1 Tax=Loa loa TaxID=7209 RepID=A0A1I7VTK6_LOALO|nr:hypothetical protein LOAG_06480 [Loa loa]EFO22009.1 hypothetical protein LOAG_06480 [Loa loa]
MSYTPKDVSPGPDQTITTTPRSSPPMLPTDVPGNRSNEQHAPSVAPMNRWLYSISCARYGTMLWYRCAAKLSHPY